MIDVTLAGVGVIGRDVARLASGRNGSARIVAACSRNPELIGRDLGELATGQPSDVAIQATLDEALERPSDVLVLATASFLDDIAPDLRTAIAAGRDVLTTSEEAAFPWARNSAVAAELEQLCARHGVTLLGAGVNPGFVFDSLVLMASGAAWDIERIAVTRTVGLSEFSDAILRRSGIGYTEEEFSRAEAEGRITGHIGLPQSMYIVARALGRTIAEIDGTIRPLVGERRFDGRHKSVEAGETAGFVQEYQAVVDGGEWFTARMIAHMDPPAAGHEISDSVEIDGAVPIRLVAQPGFDAQTTVAAVIVNSLTRLVAAPPGWVTVADLPPATPDV